MNILVTGAGGQLGNHMRLCCDSAVGNFLFSDIVASEKEAIISLDITDAQELRRVVEENDVNCIVNCAAYTNVDKAESDEELCHKLNAYAPGLMAGLLKERGGLLVHISTDYVFGEETYNTPCKEDQKGTPTGVYGKTKLEAEKIITASGCDHVIIRTSWLYSEFGHNFLKTILKLSATKENLKVVFDQVGTPTYAADLAHAIMVILKDYVEEKSSAGEKSCTKAKFYSKGGIYHFSNEGVCSWYDFAKLITEFSGQSACAIAPCHSDEFPSPVKRPSYSVLDKTKIKETFGLKIPHWVEALRVCMSNMDCLKK